ncbi:MAG: 6-phosphogluconolactonase [Cellulomonadaceae bacterium]|jgi:6-phosphogluconolactonase|nr:6-phosphogluconolactonase [Cellulomonadaceae bacterium]
MIAHQLVIVHPDADTLADAVGARWLLRLLDHQSLRRPVHTVLTGGTMGIAMLASAAASPLLRAVDWTGVHIWWGDERFCPAGHPDRNEVQARAALLDLLVADHGLPEANIHAVAGPDILATPNASAAAYADEMSANTPPGQAFLPFDILILGMGPDGHVASLFPGHAGVDVTGVATVGVDGSPKPPPQRVSLTFDAINAAREVWLIVAGAGKAERAAAALAGDPVREVPAAGVHGLERTLWLLDTAAADAP